MTPMIPHLEITLSRLVAIAVAIILAYALDHGYGAGRWR